MIKNLLHGEPRLRFHRNKKEQTIQQLLSQQANRAHMVYFLTIDFFACLFFVTVSLFLAIFFHFSFSFSSSFSSDSFFIPLLDNALIPTKDNVVHVMATF